MGRYRRNYSYADTPGNRVAHVAGIAGLWGMVGWIFTALLTSGSIGGTWALYGIGFVLIVFWGHCYVNDAAVKDKGTPEERANNPDLNTQDFDLHWKRLQRFGRSKYNGEMNYMGPRGGIYTITASGNRNYR